MTLTLGYIDLSHLLTSADAGRMAILTAGLALGVYSQRQRLGAMVRHLIGYTPIAAPAPSDNPIPSAAPWGDKMSAYRLIRTCLVVRGNVETVQLLDKEVLPCLVKEDFEFTEAPQDRES